MFPPLINPTLAHVATPLLASIQLPHRPQAINTLEHPADPHRLPEESAGPA